MAQHWQQENGITLIELMIALAIGAVTVAAGYEIFISSHRSYVTQTQLSTTQQNVRIAMELMARDARAAGFGAPQPSGVVNGLSHVVTAWNNINNVDQDDAITLVGGYQQAGTVTFTPGNNANQEGSTLLQLLSPGEGSQFNTTTKRALSIMGIFYAQIANVDGATLTLDRPLDRTYAGGEAVYRVESVTYQLDGTDPLHPALVRTDSNGPQTVVTDIEDLQFAYLLTNGAVINDAAGETLAGLESQVQAVRISLVARSRTEEVNPLAGLSRPALEDHVAATTDDGYRRRVLSRVVALRNPVY